MIKAKQLAYFGWTKGSYKPLPAVGKSKKQKDRVALLWGDLKDWLLVKRMVYGLINVRTDEEKIVMAVLKESESSFQVEELKP
ncbi:MAG: hypothetical protein ACYTFA_07305 [Planctomycetota bacterium]